MSCLEHITSCSTGHEVNGKARHPSYEVFRKMKLKDQEQDAARHTPGGKTTTLFGAKIYCDGYLEGATDTEVKRLVAAHGGTPMFVLSLSFRTVEGKAKLIVAGEARQAPPIHWRASPSAAAKLTSITLRRAEIKCTLYDLNGFSTVSQPVNDLPNGNIRSSAMRRSHPPSL
jgi:hypothetical protein